MRPRFILVAAVVGLALAAIVRADKVDRTPGASGKQSVASVGQASPVKPASTTPAAVISSRDRDAIYSYYGTKLTALDCPAGLIKMNHSCVPPEGGQGNWHIGERLSDNVMVYPLPAVLLGQLYPAHGYQYVRVGNDVLLLGIETRLVAGALADVEGS